VASASAPPALPSAGEVPRAVLDQLGEHRDVLSTWWPAGLLGGLALLLLVVVVVRRRRGRRPWLAGGATVLVLALALVAGVNTRLGLLPSAQAAETLATGRVPDTDGEVTQVQVPLRDGSGLDPSDTWVYTPPGYDDSADGADGTDDAVRYPVVYLFHGEPGSSADWFTAGDVAHTADVLIHDRLIPPVILVAPDLTAPDTDDTECLDSTRPGGPQVATHVLDVVSWVDAHYATDADPAHRVAAGMSMGGYCALDLGLRHQDVFGGVVGLEAFGSPGPGGRDALSTRAQYRAASPDHYLPRLHVREGTPFWFDLAEDGDPLSARETRRVVTDLRAKGLPVHLQVEPDAEHDWDFAAAGIAPGLTWVLDRMGLAPAPEPSSTPAS